MAPYIRTIEPGRFYLEFEFPPDSMTNKCLPMIFLNGGALPVINLDKVTHMHVVIGDRELWDFLLSEFFDKGPSFADEHPNPFPLHDESLHRAYSQYIAATSYMVKFDISGELLEEFSAAEDDHYRRSIEAMEDKKLREQMQWAIKKENYLHAAMIRDEIQKRAVAACK
jgi:hypothetical protein